MNIQNLEDKRLLLKYKICSFDIKLNPQCELDKLIDDYQKIKTDLVDARLFEIRQKKINNINKRIK